MYSLFTDRIGRPTTGAPIFLEQDLSGRHAFFYYQDGRVDRVFADQAASMASHDTQKGRPPTTEEQKAMLQTPGANIRKMREEAGLSQEALADKLGSADRQYVADVERGGVNVSATRLIEFADALLAIPAAVLDGIR